MNRNVLKMNAMQYREASYHGTKYRCIFHNSITGKCLSLKGWTRAGTGYWRQLDMNGPKALKVIAHVRETGKDWRDK